MAEEYTNSLTTTDVPAGTPMTIKSSVQQVYSTTNGQNLYDKTLTGAKKVLFPTCVDMNACFDYRFSFKDLMLVNQLPNITDMYFQNLTVKIQDVFTQITSDGAIKNGIFYTYDPYSAVISQDSNGIETEDHYIKGYSQPFKFVNSSRVVQRGDNSLYVVSSNLKIEKHINLQINSSSYKILKMFNVYDSQGNFVRKVLESDVKATSAELKECMEDIPKDSSDRHGRKICRDIILCDVLIFMLKSFNHDGINLSQLTADNLKKIPLDKSLPIGWLSPEEKLERFGKKGVFMETFVANKKSNDGSASDPYEKEIPNNLFVYVDMQTQCDKLFRVAKPDSAVFNDEKKIIAPFKAQYAIASELISVGIKSDN